VLAAQCAAPVAHHAAMARRSRTNVPLPGPRRWRRTYSARDTESAALMINVSGWMATDPLDGKNSGAERPFEALQQAWWTRRLGRGIELLERFGNRVDDFDAEPLRARGGGFGRVAPDEDRPRA